MNFLKIYQHIRDGIIAFYCTYNNMQISMLMIFHANE